MPAIQADLESKLQARVSELEAKLKKAADDAYILLSTEQVAMLKAESTKADAARDAFSAAQAAASEAEACKQHAISIAAQEREAATAARELKRKLEADMQHMREKQAAELATKQENELAQLESALQQVWDLQAVAARESEKSRQIEEAAVADKKALVEARGKLEQATWANQLSTIELEGLKVDLGQSRETCVQLQKQIVGLKGSATVDKHLHERVQGLRVQYQELHSSWTRLQAVYHDNQADHLQLREILDHATAQGQLVEADVKALFDKLHTYGDVAGQLNAAEAALVSAQSETTALRRVIAEFEGQNTEAMQELAATNTKLTEECDMMRTVLHTTALESGLLLVSSSLRNSMRHNHHVKVHIWYENTRRAMLAGHETAHGKLQSQFLALGQTAGLKFLRWCLQGRMKRQVGLALAAWHHNQQQYTQHQNFAAKEQQLRDEAQSHSSRISELDLKTQAAERAVVQQEQALVSQAQDFGDGLEQILKSVSAALQVEQDLQLLPQVRSTQLVKKAKQILDEKNTMTKEKAEWQNERNRICDELRDLKAQLGAVQSQEHIAKEAMVLDIESLRHEVAVLRMADYQHCAAAEDFQARLVVAELEKDRLNEQVEKMQNLPEQLEQAKGALTHTKERVAASMVGLADELKLTQKREEIAKAKCELLEKQLGALQAHVGQDLKDANEQSELLSDEVKRLRASVSRQKEVSTHTERERDECAKDLQAAREDRDSIKIQLEKLESSHQEEIELHREEVEKLESNLRVALGMLGDATSKLLVAGPVPPGLIPRRF